MGDVSPHPAQPHAEKLQRLKQEESRLWLLALVFLSILGAGAAAAFWQNLASVPRHLEAIPLGTVVLAVLFAVHVALKRKEIAETEGVLRGMQEREKTPPSEQQLNKLLEAVSNSQRNYRELIDSLDDLVLGVSLQGTVRTINRALTELIGKPFAEIVGHNLEEFLAEPTREQAEKHVARFLQQRAWSGVLRVRFKEELSPRYFDTVLHPIIAAGEVVGIGVLAKDITAEREREARFTELFETLQEGVYFTTADGHLVDCNIALVRMLGYERKEELLQIAVPELFVDAVERQQQV